MNKNEELDEWARAVDAVEDEDESTLEFVSARDVKHARRDPSQVYSVRIPVRYVELLRRLAERRDELPTALMRRWVIERLDAESARRGSSEQRDRLLSEMKELFLRQAEATSPSAPLDVEGQAAAARVVDFTARHAQRAEVAF